MKQTVEHFRIKGLLDIESYYVINPSVDFYIFRDDGHVMVYDKRRMHDQNAIDRSPWHHTDVQTLKADIQQARVEYLEYADRMRRRGHKTNPRKDAVIAQYRTLSKFIRELKL